MLSTLDCKPRKEVKIYRLGLGWQRGGRLNSELSVGIFVSLERTHFLKLQGSLENMFPGKKSPVFSRLAWSISAQQIKPFSHSNCCVVFVSLKLGLNRHTDSSKKFTTNLISIRHGL